MFQNSKKLFQDSTKQSNSIAILFQTSTNCYFTVRSAKLLELRGGFACVKYYWVHCISMIFAGQAMLMQFLPAPIIKVQSIASSIIFESLRWPSCSYHVSQLGSELPEQMPTADLATPHAQLFLTHIYPQAALLGSDPTPPPLPQLFVAMGIHRCRISVRWWRFFTLGRITSHIEAISHSETWSTRIS